MGAGAVVYWVCAAPPQPGQEQRLPTILQTDAGAEAAAAHRPLYRYNRTHVVRELYISFTAHVEVSFLHKMAVMLKEEFMFVFMYVCVQEMFCCWLFWLHDYH